ncbi:hypothetical protein Hanom_Chr04g00321241 [Helianthus anomalus]
MMKKMVSFFGFHGDKFIAIYRVVVEWIAEISPKRKDKNSIERLERGEWVWESLIIIIYFFFSVNMV